MTLGKPLGGKQVETLILPLAFGKEWKLAWKVRLRCYGFKDGNDFIVEDLVGTTVGSIPSCLAWKIQ